MLVEYKDLVKKVLISFVVCLIIILLFVIIFYVSKDKITNECKQCKGVVEDNIYSFKCNCILEE